MSDAKDADVDRLTRVQIEQVHARCGFCKGNQSVCYNSSARSAGERDCLLGLMRDLALQSPSQETVRDEVLEEAARIADALTSKWHTDYKIGHGPHRASAHREGMSDGAEEVAREIRSLKREPNAAARDRSTERASGERTSAGTSPSPAPAAPELEVETQFSIAKRGPKYEFEIDGKWPVVACPDPQECRRANRCLNEPPCGKFNAVTGASDA